MAKKRNLTRSGGPVFFHAWGSWEEGQYAEGTLVGTSQDKKYKRTNFHLKVEDFNVDATNQNDEPLKVGDVLVLNGCGILDKHLANVSKGDFIRVEYEGQAEITGGDWEGELAHSIAVLLEDDVNSESSSEDDDLL
tara:strand:- start:262 stop:669 length:408 start_codon:yes stop_codon:yes gene_type:complete